MEFKDTKAIYLQIADYICDQILTGRWSESERIPSVRELGVALEVNPNTAMRTYDFLQEKGIIFNKRGIGYFVDENAKVKTIELRKKQFLEDDLPFFFKNMELIGMTLPEVEKEYDKYKTKR